MNKNIEVKEKPDRSIFYFKLIAIPIGIAGCFLFNSFWAAFLIFFAIDLD